MARYIINRDNKVVHDSEHLNEKCNTDQIRLRRASDTIPQFYHKCEHCMPESINEQVDKFDDELEEELLEETQC